MLKNRRQALAMLDAASKSPPDEKPKAFSVWSIKDFLQWQEPEGCDLLGKGLLRKGDLSVLHGSGGLGKSRLSLWLSFCQILGLPFAGLPTSPEPQTWLFIGNENSIARQKADVMGMLEGCSPAEVEKLEEHLRFHVLLEADDCQLDISDAATCERFKATLESVKPSVLVLDPWGALTADEDKGQECRATLKSLTRIWKSVVPDCAVLVLAHSRVGQSNLQAGISVFGAGSALKGSKVLWATARAVMMLCPRGEDPNELVLVCDKSNNGPKFAPRGLLFHTEPMRYEIDLDFDESSWRADVSGERSKAKTVTIADIANAVALGECRNTAAIVERFGDLTSERTIKRRIGEAVRGGYLEATLPRGSFITGKNYAKLKR